MANEENGKHQNLSAEQEPELLPPTDMLYLRMEEISSAMLSFYEMIANGNPKTTEKFIAKYPMATAAKLRIAPVIFSKILPAKKQIEVNTSAPRRKLSPTQLLKLGVKKDELKRLAGIKEDAE